MEQSIIRLEKITLESLKFTKNAQALQRTNIPPTQLRFNVTTEVLENTLIAQSRCEISILKDENQDDFEIQLTYLITASILDASNKEALEKFAKFGAPFNALVYARDLISSITSRAFGQAAMLPLLDIQQLGASITLKETPETQGLPQPPDTPQPVE